MDETPRAIQRAVEVLHVGRATVVDSVAVRETFDDGTVWEGLVHVVDLVGNTRAERAYAWYASAKGGGEQRFFVALHMWNSTSPAAAVRDAMKPERISRKQ